MRWWRLSWWRLSWWRGNWRRVWDIGLAFSRRVCTFCILRRGLGSSRRGKEERKIYGGFLRRRWRRRYLKQPATEEKWLAKVVVIQIQDFKLLQFCYLLRYFPGKWIVSKNTANKNKVDVDDICIYWIVLRNVGKNVFTYRDFKWVKFPSSGASVPCRERSRRFLRY